MTSPRKAAFFCADAEVYSAQEYEALAAQLAEAERDRDWYRDCHRDHCAMSCDDTPPWKRTANGDSDGR